MKYTIKGLTNATLAINSLKITIRGNSKNTNYYPNSIFYNIEVSEQTQFNELNDLSKKGYLSYELTEGEKPALKEPIKTSKIAKASETAQINLSNSSNSKKEVPKKETAKKPESKKEVEKTKVSEKVNKNKKIVRRSEAPAKSLKDEIEDDINASVVMAGGKPVRGRNVAPREESNVDASLKAEKQLIIDSLKEEPVNDSTIWVDDNGNKIDKDIIDVDALLEDQAKADELDEFIE